MPESRGRKSLHGMPTVSCVTVCDSQHEKSSDSCSTSHSISSPRWCWPAPHLVPWQVGVQGGLFPTCGNTYCVYMCCCRTLTRLLVTKPRIVFHHLGTHMTQSTVCAFLQGRSKESTEQRASSVSQTSFKTHQRTRTVKSARVLQSKVD